MAAIYEIELYDTSVSGGKRNVSILVNSWPVKIPASGAQLAYLNEGAIDVEEDSNPDNEAERTFTATIYNGSEMAVWIACHASTWNMIELADGFQGLIQG